MRAIHREARDFQKLARSKYYEASLERNHKLPLESLRTNYRQALAIRLCGSLWKRYSTHREPFRLQSWRYPNHQSPKSVWLLPRGERSRKNNLSHPQGGHYLIQLNRNTLSEATVH